jgi:hypothetical protein
MALYPKSLARNPKKSDRSSAKHRAQFTLGEFGMDDRVIDILAALCVAAVAAVIAWFVAHYVFGVSSLNIRMSNRRVSNRSEIRVWTA